MPTIRAASVRDLPGAYRVCLMTGDAGRDASAIYRNPELLGHVFVGPYVVGQPDLALVVADDAGIAGYMLAAADTRSFERWAEEEWWPPLREQYPLTSDGSPESELIELLYRSPFADDSVVVPFPSHLHIDLLERVRGQGYGRLLIERLLDELRRRGSPGVHLDVDIANANAIAFYRHLGFDELERSHDALVMGLRLGGLTCMVHDRGMTTNDRPGPDPEAIVSYITETWPETDVVQAMNAWFFSLDDEKHWPNYATLVTTDEHDDASNLSRPGAFRLNMGVDRETFWRLAAANPYPDYTTLDTVLPHPVYAAQHWICIVSPSEVTFRDVVVPLLTVAHDRLAEQRARHGFDK